MTTTTINTNSMPPGCAKLFNILRHHTSRKKAISMATLYERWSGETLERNTRGRVIDDVPTLSRGMRKLIDDLRDLYGVPVMSSSGAGYWIVSSTKELISVREEFRSRGLKSLATAARLGKISLVDEVSQLSLDLSNGKVEKFKPSESRKRKLPADHEALMADVVLSDEKRMTVVTAHLKEILSDPDKYSEQIKQLQKQFGPRLVPHAVLVELKENLNKSRHAAKFMDGELARALDSLDL